MTEWQAKRLYKTLDDFYREHHDRLGGYLEFHHGDCKGVDVQAASIAKQIGFTVVCHPPLLTDQQGFFGGDYVHPPLGYLKRDRNIVDSTSVLLVVPAQMTHQPRGGTWYTHDYAKKKNKQIIMVWPQPSCIKTTDSPVLL